MSPWILNPGAPLVRRAPVQGSPGRIARGMPGHRPGTISWEEHQRAWEAYSKRYGNDQSAARIAERAGFCYQELTEFLGHEPTTWQEVEAQS